MNVVPGEFEADLQFLCFVVYLYSMPLHPSLLDCHITAYYVQQQKYNRKKAGVRYMYKVERERLRCNPIASTEFELLQLICRTPGDRSVRSEDRWQGD